MCAQALFGGVAMREIGMASGQESAASMGGLW